jgi:hypothetical protein
MMIATAFDSALFVNVFDKSIIEHEGIDFKGQNFLIRVYKLDEGITKDYVGGDSYGEMVESLQTSLIHLVPFHGNCTRGDSQLI